LPRRSLGEGGRGLISRNLAPLASSVVNKSV